MNQRIVYLCTGNKPDCRKTMCLLAGKGECQRTTDERYALNTEHHFVTLEDGTLWEVWDEESD